MAESPQIHFESKAAWETWLATNHARLEGIWLKFAKKASGIPSVNYAEALEVALCFGWIDAQMQKFDDKFYLQKFTPRRPRSVWSQVNKQSATKLIAAGKMRPAGLAAIKQAKQNGNWDRAYASPANATVPTDFNQALGANPAALKHFDSLTKSQRYSFIWRINDARLPATRAARIQKFVEMLARGGKII